jgi:hypothetical protein
MASACASEVVMVLCINYKRVTATLIDTMNTMAIDELRANQKSADASAWTTTAQLI